jgi:hypothetical protein
MHSDPPDRIESAKRTAGNSVLLQRNRAESEAAEVNRGLPLSAASGHSSDDNRSGKSTKTVIADFSGSL